MAQFFISHSSVHKAYCEDVARVLKTLGHEAWLDAFDIAGGTTIPASIVDGIYGSDFFVLVVTPEVHKSSWISWELSIATYREIQLLRRTFVIPGLRMSTPLVRMVAHKNHLDFSGTPNDTAQKLAGVAGGGAVPPAPLAADTHVIMMEMLPLVSGTISPRRLEEVVWRTITVTQRGYSFFPAALRSHNLSVGADHVVVGLDEKTFGRVSSTMFSRDGSLRVAETNFSAYPGYPVVDGPLLIRKIARFVDLTGRVTKELGLAGNVDLVFRVAGTDRQFMLSHDPSEIVGSGIGAVRSRFDLPVGRPLSASLQNIDPRGADVLRLTDEVQADILYPLRVRRDPLVGGGEFSIRYSPEAVRRYAGEALRDIWS